jgi:ABC-type nitrate/sulfonate/bicarbonate transport system permease component
MIGLALSVAIWQIATATKFINSIAAASAATVFNTLGRNLGRSVLWAALATRTSGCGQ